MKIKLNLKALELAINTVAAVSYKVIEGENPYFELINLNGWSVIACPTEADEEDVIKLLESLGAMVCVDQINSDDELTKEYYGNRLIREYVFSLTEFKFKKSVKAKVDNDKAYFDECMKLLLNEAFRLSPFDDAVKFKITGVKNVENVKMWKVNYGGFKFLLGINDDDELETRIKKIKKEAK